MPRADRLFALVQLLASPVRRSMADLASALETTPRSIYRDLADLESRGIAIERDGGHYRLVQGASMRSAIPMTPRERVLLTLALENPHIESQPAFRKPIRDLRTKLAAGRARGVAVWLSGPDRSGEIAAEIVCSIEDAIATAHSISVFYDSLNSGTRKWRGIDPWLLIHRSEAWYLIGRCHEHDEPRTFRLDRITAVLPIGTSFRRPEDLDADRWFERSWGVETSSETNDVHIVFEPAVAPLIEHARHHPNEIKARRDDGRLDYHVRLGPLEEIARWITGFGGLAIAMAPPDLITRVQSIAAGAAAAHAGMTLKRSARRVEDRREMQGD